MVIGKGDSRRLEKSRKGWILVFAFTGFKKVVAVVALVVVVAAVALVVLLPIYRNHFAKV